VVTAATTSRLHSSLNEETIVYNAEALPNVVWGKHIWNCFLFSMNNLLGRTGESYLI
jgi:hypothetical protein